MQTRGRTAKGPPFGRSRRGRELTIRLDCVPQPLPAASASKAPARRARILFPPHPRPLGCRAIVFNRISGIKDTVYEEGTHFMVPWFERPIIYDVSPRRLQALPKRSRSVFPALVEPGLLAERLPGAVVALCTVEPLPACLPGATGRPDGKPLGAAALAARPAHCRLAARPVLAPQQIATAAYPFAPRHASLDALLGKLLPLVVQVRARPNVITSTSGSRDLQMVSHGTARPASLPACACVLRLPAGLQCASKCTLCRAPCPLRRATGRRLGRGCAVGAAVSATSRQRGRRFGWEQRCMLRTLRQLSAGSLICGLPNPPFQLNFLSGPTQPLRAPGEHWPACADAADAVAAAGNLPHARHRLRG